jgi:hypothetical protein
LPLSQCAMFSECASVRVQRRRRRRTQRSDAVDRSQLCRFMRIHEFTTGVLDCSYRHVYIGSNQKSHQLLVHIVLPAHTCVCVSMNYFALTIQLSFELPCTPPDFHYTHHIAHCHDHCTHGMSTNQCRRIYRNGAHSCAVGAQPMPDCLQQICAKT